MQEDNEDMISEDNLLPISALQHFFYCPRQCALIHIEQQWSDNLFTAEGNVLHDRVDRQEHEIRQGIRFEYSVLLRSKEHGLIGKADLVEYHGRVPVPVEHKRGRPKPDYCDMVQLCAQALCLEEMLNVSVPQGAIFYGQPRRRQIVAFDLKLRDETVAVINQVRALLETGKTPRAEYDKKKCRACSLLEICMPEMRMVSVEKYIQDALV